MQAVAPPTFLIYWWSDFAIQVYSCNNSEVLTLGSPFNLTLDRPGLGLLARRKTHTDSECKFQMIKFYLLTWPESPPIVVIIFSFLSFSSPNLRSTAPQFLIFFRSSPWNRLLLICPCLLVCSNQFSQLTVRFPSKLLKSVAWEFVRKVLLYEPLIS